MVPWGPPSQTVISSGGTVVCGLMIHCDFRVSLTDIKGQKQLGFISANHFLAWRRKTPTFRPIPCPEVKGSMAQNFLLEEIPRASPGSDVTPSQIPLSQKIFLHFLNQAFIHGLVYPEDSKCRPATVSYTRSLHLMGLLRQKHTFHGY